jgi:hypothetical protein
MRSVKGCRRLDRIKNEDNIGNKTENIISKKYNRYTLHNWDRMTDERIPKHILYYKPKGVEIEETIKRVREDERGLAVCTINWRRETKNAITWFVTFRCLINCKCYFVHCHCEIHY